MAPAAPSSREPDAGFHAPETNGLPASAGSDLPYHLGMLLEAAGLTSPTAVIDIGSNSGRVLVVRSEESGYLDVVETVGAPLRLVHDLAQSGELSQTVLQRTIEVLRGFQAIAHGAGARKVVAVATAAVREAKNGAAFTEALERATGLEILTVAGDLEARYGFLGAVYGLPVIHGMLVDIGGGSLQVVHFRDRRMQRAWSVPLGALRLSDEFLRTDPPTVVELNALREHVRGTLRAEGIPQLMRDEVLVGTGGTLRNLAKIGRGKQPYPLSRLHGFTVTREDVRRVVTLLATRPSTKRSDVDGLNSSRVDSIVGGAVCADTVMDMLRAASLTVSGEGLREGVVRARLYDTLPPPPVVRRASIFALGRRFTTWCERAAVQREEITQQLGLALDPGAELDVREALSCAALVLDIGRSVDYYNLHEHTADIVSASDVLGFSHRGLAQVAAIVRLADKAKSNLKAFAPLLGPTDQAPLGRAGAVLSLADGLARMVPPGASLDLTCERRDGYVALASPWLEPWPVEGARRQVRRIFGVDVSLAS